MLTKPRLSVGAGGAVGAVLRLLRPAVVIRSAVWSLLSSTARCAGRGVAFLALPAGRAVAVACGSVGAALRPVRPSAGGFASYLFFGSSKKGVRGFDTSINISF